MKPFENLPTRAGYLEPVTSKVHLETPARESVVDVTSDSEADSDSLVGSTIGNYRILSVIASGGMGTFITQSSCYPSVAMWR